MFMLVVMVVAGSWMAGCGVKAPPRPPKRLPPAVVTDLTGVMKRDIMNLMWGIPPREDETGEAVAFVVYRAKTPVEEAECIDCPLIFTQAAQVSVTPSDRRSGRMSFSEPLQKGYRYRYKVRSMDAFGVGSDDSNTFSIDY